MSMSTVTLLRNLKIERRIHTRLLAVVACALVVMSGRPRAQDATAGLAIRLNVEVPERFSRDLAVWEELPLEVAVENVGEAQGIPVAAGLLTGPYGGATLVARIRNLTTKAGSEEGFGLGEDKSSSCGPSASLLQPGQTARHQGSVCVRLDVISTGPDTVREQLVAAFPSAGRYSVRVVYTLGGRSAESPPIEINVGPVRPNAAGALTALRDMGRAGLWVYRQNLMSSDPKRLASITRFATEFQDNGYSDLACYALASYNTARALDSGVHSDMRNARLREALAYVERVSSPPFPRRDASEKLRGRINELLRQ